jgi:hypothetical protein
MVVEQQFLAAAQQLSYIPGVKILNLSSMLAQRIALSGDYRWR